MNELNEEEYAETQPNGGVFKWVIYSTIGWICLLAIIWLICSGWDDFEKKIDINKTADQVMGLICQKGN